MSTIHASANQQTRSRRHERRAERRRLQRVDVLSGRLAELYAIRALLDRAAEATGRGWVQDAWFTVDMATGERRVTASGMRLAENEPVTGACLVGSVVQAAGGPSMVRSQLVQRTLDLARGARPAGPLVSGAERAHHARARPDPVERCSGADAGRGR
jgi:hypothetical protein